MSPDPSTRACKPRCFSGGERGAVLIVALIMLLLMTLLGVTAMNTSNLEVVMATNTQASTRSLANGENSMVDGEARIITEFNGTPLFDWSTNATDGLFITGDPIGGVPNGSVISDIAWDTGGYETAGNSKYTLEYLGPFTTAGASLTLGAATGGTDRRYLYRVTGRGASGRGGIRFVQSIFATRD